jgi:putative DNA primase/helicase
MSFIEFARTHGVLIDPAKLFPSDRIRRTGTHSKPRSDNGAYFWDGQRGWVMDWSTGGKPTWWNDSTAKPWTDSEKRVWIERRRAKAADQEASYVRVALEADKALNAAQITNHEYLTYKGFKHEVGFVDGKKLMIPMRNLQTHNLQGFQTICWNPQEKVYEKKMLTGMRAKQAVFTFGTRGKETWLVEGYATGLSLRAALRQSRIPACVIVCFSAHNLITVAKSLWNSQDIADFSSRVYVFADNDKSQTGEKAAVETGFPWTMADEEGWDANDLHQKKGLFPLVQKLISLRHEYIVP